MPEIRSKSALDMGFPASVPASLAASTMLSRVIFFIEIVVLNNL